MSYYLIDFGSSKVNFNFDNLIIGKKIKLDNNNSKYFIYHQQENEDPKEIYIRLPRLRLIYNMSNSKFNQLNIPIYPNWEQTNNFINFIKQLESDIESCFSNKNKEWISILNKKNSLNFFKTSIYENFKITSNIENKKINLNDFQINGQIDIVIKISHIWNKNNKIGLSSQLYQIKYLAPPEQLEINFIDPEKKKEIINTEEILIKPVIKTDENIKVLPPQIKLIPNIKDLEKAISKLKPTKHLEY
jgi:hypothetical protein